MFDWACTIGDTAGNPGAAQITCLEPLLKNVIRGAMSLTGIALFVMLIISGYTFLFSGGDPKKLEKAKGTMSAAIVGLVVIVVAYLIIKAIQIFTGVDVTTFSISVN